MLLSLEQTQFRNASVSSTTHEDMDVEDVEQSRALQSVVGQTVFIVNIPLDSDHRFKL